MSDTTDVPEPESVGDNKDVNHKNALELLEEKRCSICEEIMINACRISCGHTFCRYCIETTMAQPDVDGRKKCCTICDAKINEIQNCPEIDKEIDILFTGLSVKKKLDRAGKKADRKHQIDQNKNELSTSVDINQNLEDNENEQTSPHIIFSNDESETADAGNVNSNFTTYHFYPPNTNYYSSESQYLESGEPNDPVTLTASPLCVHETLTVHRVRVISANVDDDSESQNQHQNCQNHYQLSDQDESQSQPHTLPSTGPYYYYGMNYPHGQRSGDLAQSYQALNYQNHHQQSCPCSQNYYHHQHSNHNHQHPQYSYYPTYFQPEENDESSDIPFIDYPSTGFTVNQSGPSQSRPTAEQRQYYSAEVLQDNYGNTLDHNQDHNDNSERYDTGNPFIHTFHIHDNGQSLVEFSGNSDNNNEDTESESESEDAASCRIQYEIQLNVNLQYPNNDFGNFIVGNAALADPNDESRDD